MKNILSTLLIIYSIKSVFADPNVVINNNPPSNSNAPTQNNCNNNVSSSDNSGIEPGTYKSRNPDGTSDTIYTTGDKKPFIVDNNNCNTTSPVIQPYINVPPGPRPLMKK